MSSIPAGGRQRESGKQSPPPPGPRYARNSLGYMYICVYICVCIYVYMCICVYVFMYIYMHLCMDVYIFVRIERESDKTVYMYICVFAYFVYEEGNKVGTGKEVGGGRYYIMKLLALR